MNFRKHLMKFTISELHSLIHVRMHSKVVNAFCILTTGKPSGQCLSVKTKWAKLRILSYVFNMLIEKNTYLDKIMLYCYKWKSTKWILKRKNKRMYLYYTVFWIRYSARHGPTLSSDSSCVMPSLPLKLYVLSIYITIYPYALNLSKIDSSQKFPFGILVSHLL